MARIAGRPRRPTPGILLHIDGSKHRWFSDDRYNDLLARAARDDRASRPVLRVVQPSRQSFLRDLEGGEKVDPHRSTQVGQALKELGVQLIAAYSPTSARTS